MSARRCRGCGQSIRNPHVAGCPRASHAAPANTAEAEVLHELRKVSVFPLPPAPRRADLLEQEETLRFYLQPERGEA